MNTAPYRVTAVHIPYFSGTWSADLVAPAANQTASLTGYGDDWTAGFASGRFVAEPGALLYDYRADYTNPTVTPLTLDGSAGA